MRRAVKRLQAERCLKQGLEKKKPRIPACPLGKQLSHFANPGLLLANLNDFVIG